MIDDDRLHDVLVARATRGVDLDLAATARAIARDPKGRSRYAATRTYTLAAAVALVVAGAAIGLTVVSSPPMPTHSANPAPSSSIRLPAGVEPWPTLTWSAVVPGEHRLASVVEWKGGFVGAGSSYNEAQDRHTAHVSTSEDGRAWLRIAELPGVSVFRVVTWEDELVLVGHYPTPGMWRSGDGRTWTEVDLPDDWMEIWQPIEIAVGPEDWLVRGVITFDGPSIWLRGRPGGEWAEVTLDPEVVAGAAPFAIVASDDLWVAGGAAGRVINEPRPSHEPPIYEHGAFWWSADGNEWTAATVDRPGGYVSQVLRVDRGWVAIGGNERCPGCDWYALAWRSTDGRAWQQIDLGPVEPNSFQGLQLRGDGRRGLVLDTVAGQLRGRETFDGLAWREIPMESAAGLPLNNLFHRSSPVVGSNAFVAFWREQVYVAVPAPVPE